MKQKNALSPVVYVLGIPVLLLAITVFLALNLNQLQSQNDWLSMGVTIDFIITVPLVYFALIRKRKISKFTIMPFFVLGLVLATLTIPAAYQGTLTQLKTWLVPVVEITVISIILTKIRKLRKAYKIGKSENLDFLTALKSAAKSIFPEKLAFAFTTEIGLIYYSFFVWRKPQYATNQFTYHKESGLQGILGTVLFVSLIELFSVHLLIQDSYPILSWVLTGISIYGVIQVFGLIKSVPRTPHFITDDELVLRMGLFLESRIPLNAIESVELTTTEYPQEDKTYQKITLFDHNCMIHLNEEATLNGLFGRKKSFKHLALFVDDKNGFKSVLEAQGE